MWRWLVVWQASLLLVSGTLDVRFLNSRYASSQVKGHLLTIKTQNADRSRWSFDRNLKEKFLADISETIHLRFDCFDYPAPFPMRQYDPGWGLPRKVRKMLHTTTERYHPTPFAYETPRRIDLFLSNKEDIIKEHAKLVQDINGLKQVMFVAPIADESKDYDDSIFHEIIETTSTTTSRPSTTKTSNSAKGGFPIILLGGSSASRKHTLKNPSLKNQRQTLSLVGTSVSPLVRHPYPIITAASARQPVRICMSSPFPYPTATRRPSLWERLLKSIVPR